MSDQQAKDLGTLVAFLAVLGYVATLSSSMGQIRFQVRTLWDVFFESAKVELVQRGFAKAQSPIRIVAGGYDFVKPYLGELFPIYRKVRNASNHWTDSELERKLFQTFQTEAKDLIIQKVCLPNGLTLGAGIMAVIQACQYAQEQGATV